MILSRNISLDTSSTARTHFGTSFLKYKRHQDLLCNYKRTWGKYPTRNNLTLSSSAAEATTVNMSIKADVEPNNNVSIEEEVRQIVLKTSISIGYKAVFCEPSEVSC